MAFATVGCRLNQAESEAALEDFISAGWNLVDFSSEADVYYINTCTVTGRADRSSRQLIHRARRQNSNAVVIAAGCFAELGAGELADNGEVDVILGNVEKMRPLEHLPREGRPQHPVVAVGLTAGYGQVRPAVGSRVAGRTRAFLKVQDGCDHACAYCAVRFARGLSRSVPIDEVRLALQRVRSAGYEEVVFTGVDLSAWGRDLPGETKDFTFLVESAASAGFPRIRFSSLEPWEITGERIRYLADIPAWCPHLHLSLQSAAPSVLKRMNRETDLAALRKTISELLKMRPDATIGADLIAGYPGESEEDFRHTLAFLDNAPLHYLHVFPFSPRPGTPAAEMNDGIDPDTIAARAKRLRDEGVIRKRSHMAEAVGRSMEVLVEKSGTTGYTRNYLRVKLVNMRAKAGSRVTVLVKCISENEDFLLAEVAEG